MDILLWPDKEFIFHFINTIWIAYTFIGKDGIIFHLYISVIVWSTVIVAVFQSLNHVWHFATPWTVARQTPLSFTISEFAQIHVHWVDDAI